MMLKQWTKARGWLGLVFAGGLALPAALVPAGAGSAQPVGAVGVAGDGVDSPKPLASADLVELSQQSTALAQRCRAATVGIMMPGGGMGSGVIVDDTGLVLTAAHVLPEAGGAVTIVLHDGRLVPAQALGVNRRVDSGMARITAEGTYPSMPVAQAGGLWEGDWCLALGHAAGVQVDRPAPLRLGRIVHVSSRAAMTGAITTDCTVVSGDSGGPLFNLRGEVIGIHSNIEMNVLVNRHVPIDVYHAQWDALLEPQEVSAMPEGAGRVEPGLSHLPEYLQRELTRRLASGDPALREAVEAARDDAGEVALSLEQVAELMGRADLIEGLRRYERDLAAREARTQALNQAEGSLGSDGPGKIDERLAETREILRGAARERAMEEIAQTLRRTHGKIADHVVSQFDAVTLGAGSCVVEVVCQREVVALGTVVRADGYIVTKASELNGPVTVRLHDQDLRARIVNGDFANDIALLQIEREGLTPVRWSSEAPPLGALMVAPGPDAMPLALGVVGVEARPIPERVNNLREPVPSAPFLGVSGLSDADSANGAIGANGAEVGSVVPGTPAHDAGLIAGDVVTAINGESIPNAQTLAETIAGLAVGESIVLGVRRAEGDGAGTLDIEVTLGDRADFAPLTPQGQEDRGPSAAETYSARGGKLSARRTRFPSALQHDAILWSADIGGPMLNLRGEAVGLNIARYGRTATYAIPAAQAQQVIARMMRGR